MLCAEPLLCISARDEIGRCYMRARTFSAYVYALALVLGGGLLGFWVFGSGVEAMAQSDGLERTPAPENASVYIISPADGAVVASPVLVRFGLSGMGIAPAGVPKENTGHHHLAIDRDLPSVDDYLPASDETFRHFGGGQTETMLDLAPGTHTLQLILGDQDHLPHDPPVFSEQITITVE